MSGESPELALDLIVVAKSWSPTYFTVMPLRSWNFLSDSVKSFSSSPPKAPRIVTSLSPTALPPLTAPFSPPALSPPVEAGFCRQALVDIATTPHRRAAVESVRIRMAFLIPAQPHDGRRAHGREIGEARDAAGGL